MERPVMFAYYVDVLRPTIARDGGPDHQWQESIVSAACESLNEALAKGVRDATYYLSVDWKKARVRVLEECRTCCGQGKVLVPVGRKGKLKIPKQCKACKGKPIKNQIGPFEVEIHPNASLTGPQ